MLILPPYQRKGHGSELPLFHPTLILADLFALFWKHKFWMQSITTQRHGNMNTGWLRTSQSKHLPQSSGFYATWLIWRIAWHTGTLRTRYPESCRGKPSMLLCLIFASVLYAPSAYALNAWRGIFSYLLLLQKQIKHLHEVVVFIATRNNPEEHTKFRLDVKKRLYKKYQDWLQVQSYLLHILN